MNLQEILDKLSKNRVFRLSLTSQELFHSNFWGWLLDDDERWKNYSGLFDENLPNLPKPKILRGQNGLTLSLKFDDGLYIIENRLKSIIDKPQIESIWQDADKKNLAPKKILVVTYPDLNFHNTNWSVEDDYDYKKSYNIQTAYLTYEELLNRFKAQCITDGFLSEYTECLELLISMKNSFKYTLEENCSAFWNFYGENREKLLELDLDVMFQKASAANLVTKILQDTPYKEDIRVIIGTDNERELPELQLWLHANDRLVEDIGISICGYEYRFCAYIFKETDEGKNSDLRKKYSEKLQESKFKNLFNGTIKSIDYQLYSMLYTKEALIEDISIGALIEKIKSDLDTLHSL